jgi:penicillin amidase
VKAWDNFNHEDSEGAAYFEAWWTEIMRMTWDEMYNENAVLDRPTSFNTIKLLKEQPNLSFFDIQSTPEKETAKEVVQKSLGRAVAKISKWKREHGQEKVQWADYKDSYIGHLLPPLRSLGINVRHGGSTNVVNAHSRTDGPSWRMIVSLEKTGVKTWAVYPGGQSGNPGSYYYSNMVDRWVADQHYPMIFKTTITEIEKHALYSTLLKPISK